MRDPLDATREDDDASDQISDASSNNGHTEDAGKESASSVGQPASKANDPQLNEFETPLGLVPTATPNFVQHVGAFKGQLELVQDAVKKMRRAAQPGKALSGRERRPGKHEGHVCESQNLSLACAAVGSVGQAFART